MQQPLQITIRDIENSPGIEKHLEEKVQKLISIFNNHIISCHIVVDLTQKHQHVGKLHNVNIRVFVPGKELVATRQEAENLWIAIRDAFHGIHEQLSTYRDQLRHHVKTHPDKIHGTITRLFDDFGFILGPDGVTEYYFNTGNIVATHFNKLKIGAPVDFIEAVGNEGLQAKRVSVHAHH